jgi:hypothetical protein
MFFNVYKYLYLFVVNKYKSKQLYNTDLFIQDEISITHIEFG